MLFASFTTSKVLNAGKISNSHHPFFIIIYAISRERVYLKIHFEEQPYNSYIIINYVVSFFVVINWPSSYLKISSIRFLKYIHKNLFKMIKNCLRYILLITLTHDNNCIINHYVTNNVQYSASHHNQKYFQLLRYWYLPIFLYFVLFEILYYIIIKKQVLSLLNDFYLSWKQGDLYQAENKHPDSNAVCRYSEVRFWARNDFVLAGYCKHPDQRLYTHLPCSSWPRYIFTLALTPNLNGDLFDHVRSFILQCMAV